MMLRHPLLQAILLVLVAVICALVANAAASPQRRLVLIGSYPNALRVPTRTTSPTNEATSTSNRTAPTQSTESAGVPASAATAMERPTEPQGVTLRPAPVSPTTTQPRPSGPETTTTAKTATVHHVTAGTASGSKPIPAPATQSAPPATRPLPARSDVSRFAPHFDKPYVEIAGADVEALHSAGVLFLDARRTSVYEQGHIAGARSVSVWESDLEEKVRKLFDERSEPREQAKPVVIYCSGGDCEDSHMLAEKLWGIQFNNLYVYKDGFPDWQKRGGAIHQGSTP